MAASGSGIGGGISSGYVGRLASNLWGTLDYWELSERFAGLNLRYNLQVLQCSPSPSREDLFLAYLSAEMVGRVVTSWTIGASSTLSWMALVLWTTVGSTVSR